MLTNKYSKYDKDKKSKKLLSLFFLDSEPREGVIVFITIIFFLRTFSRSVDVFKKFHAVVYKLVNERRFYI